MNLNFYDGAYFHNFKIRVAQMRVRAAQIRVRAAPNRGCTSHLLVRTFFMFVQQIMVKAVKKYFFVGGWVGTP